MAERGKRTYVSDKTFAELMKSAEQALAYERGEQSDCRITRVISGPLQAAREVTPAKKLLSARLGRRKPQND
ncbi:MAG: hypothetical protein LC800_20455 [Acidobacteria bacterium]|nr:hypothetical protein [Acidobacteriota bacterium]